MKIDGVAQMVIILTTKEMNYLVVDIYDNLVARFCIYIGDINILPALFALIRP